MFLSGKALLIILIIIMVATLSLATMGAYLLQQEVDKSAILDSDLKQALKIQGKFKSSLESADKEIVRLNTLFSQSREQIDSLNSKISTLQDEKSELSRKLTGLQNQFEASEDKNIDFEKETAVLKRKLELTEKELTVAMLKKDDLAKKLANIQAKTRESISLEKIVVGEESLEGKVVSINKKFKFLIIDRGEKDSVKVGEVFRLFDNGRDIGQIKIEKVYETLSSANFLPNLEVKSLKEGLRVVRN